MKNAVLVNEGRCVKGEMWIKDGKIEGIRRVEEEGEGLFSDGSRRAVGDSLADAELSGRKVLPGEAFPEGGTRPLQTGWYSLQDGFAMGKEYESAGCQVMDLKGACVLPGIIDDQVHFRQPGLTHKGDIASESLAALKGGVTSFMDMPNTKPQTLTQDLLAQKYRMGAEDSHVNYSFYMGCSEDNLDEVLKTDPRDVCGIKLFLGSSTGNMLVEDPAYLEALFANAPTIVAAHCEEEGIIRQNTADFKARYGDAAPFSIHPLVRSAEACYQSSSKAAALARKHGAKLHILHLSTAKELELLGDDGISGEICVHYLWFSDQDYGKYGWRMKCNPAIKTFADREALRRAVKSGKLVVATDHAPHTYEEKQKPYFECPSGSPWVGHSLPMMLELVRQGVFSLTDVVESMCHRPARLFQIAGRGFLRPGYAADLAIVDPEQAWQVDKQNIDYKCGWSALEGQVLHGKVLSTFVNGNLVYDRGEVLMPGYRGERLLFER